MHNLVPNSVVQAHWYSVFVYDLVVVVTKQLNRIGSGPRCVGCLVCDARVQPCLEYLLFGQELFICATSRLEYRKLNLISPPQSEGNTNSVLS